jgi:hypothetical protein
VVVQPPEFLLYFDPISERWRSRSDDELDVRSAMVRRIERWDFARQTWCVDNGWTVEQLDEFTRFAKG